MKRTRPAIDRKATLGIDLGDRKHAIGALNAEGEIVAEMTDPQYQGTVGDVGEALSQSTDRYGGGKS
tara:strand:- start:253 stop:453 length:201 start_codon:yes stop_codon:yes gene_type:complete